MSGISVLCKIAVLSVIVCGISSGAQLNSNETEAKIFAQQTSDKVFQLFDEIKDAAFDDNAIETYDYEGATRNSSNVLASIVKEANDFEYWNFKDKHLKEDFIEISRLAGDQLLGFERNWELSSTQEDIERVLTRDKSIEGYQDSSVFVAYEPDILNIKAESDDPDELKHYWLQWRKLSNEKCKKFFTLSYHSLIDAANLTEISNLRFYLGQYNVTEMENAMKDIQPLYLEIHAFVRHQLWMKYGSSVIEPNGLIPDHLYQQVKDQIWSNNSIVEEVYPHDSLPPFESVLKERFEPESLLRIIDRFYEHLGFTPFPEKHWGSRIKVNKNEENDEYDCENRVSYNTPNVYLEYCKKMNFMKFMDLYDKMGKIYYAKEMTGIPAYYFNTHDLDYSIGKAAQLSASTLRNLKAIGMIVDFNITDEMEMNRLLRMSIHTLFSIPAELVKIKLMVDLLSEKIGFKDVNNHYWNLMKKYAGVGPPKERDPSSLDLPLSFYVDHNEEMRKFETEVLGFQIYKKLCEISGKYPKEALHKCVIHGSKDVGEALRKMMRLGVTERFKVVFGTLFPDDQTIKAESLLEYCSPIKKLISKKNHEDKVTTGW